MKNIAGIISIVALLVIASCKSDKKCGEQATLTPSEMTNIKKDFDTITYEHFIIKVPHTAKVVDYLDLKNPATVLQLNDSVNDYFVKVVEEESDLVNNALKKIPGYQSNKNLFENYIFFAEKGIYSKINDYKLINSNKTLLDSCNTKIYKFYGKEERPSADKNDTKVFPVYYHVAIIEADKHFYQIVTWTPKEKENSNAEKMQGIINSFEKNTPIK